MLAWRIPWISVHGVAESDVTERVSLSLSFRIDWFNLLAVQETQESFPAPHLESIYSSALHHFYGPTLTSIHDYWTNHSVDYTDLC